MVLSREMSNCASEATGILVPKIVHASGKLEWKVMPADYDYSQELARAAFADMLHDSERNKLYRVGLQAAIKKVRERGEEVRVLDIGTGTGLLSMMAAVEGVDSIVACEEFRPMAEIASRIIQLNGFQDKIKLVRKRSDELTVGPGCDLEKRANILVTEVFDTELIGEGAIGTYNHANRELLTDDRIVVPGRARMFAQVVCSKVASNWNILNDIQLDDENTLTFGQNYRMDNLVLHDIQLSQMKESDYVALSHPIQVFDFDLACRKGPIPSKDQSIIEFKALNTGVATAIFMWWDCYTDPDEQVLLSCAPHWQHHQAKDQAWRDHWMQAVYFPTKQINIQHGESVNLVSNHDQYSLWFDVQSSKQSQEDLSDTSHPHYLPFSRIRLQEVNNMEHNKIYTHVMSQTLRNAQNIVCLGDQSVLGLMAAKLSQAKVTIVQQNVQMTKLLKQMSKENGLTERLHFKENIEELENCDKFDGVISDVFFTGSVLPWHNLLYWYQINDLRKNKLLTESAIILPGEMELWFVPVHYQHLYKIRAPLNKIEGFDMKHFDDLIEKASDTCDENVEPHPLWEYPCIPLAPPTRALTVCLADGVPDKDITYTGTVDITSQELDVNGMALWCTWNLDQEASINTGPVSEIMVGKQMEWSKGHKQGVHFFKHHKASPATIKYNINFLPQEGDFKFDFSFDK